jgi:hypothetical protein
VIRPVPGIPSGNLISYVAKTHIIDKVGLRLVRYSNGRDKIMRRRKFGSVRRRMRAREREARVLKLRRRKVPFEALGITKRAANKAFLQSLKGRA